MAVGGMFRVASVLMLAAAGLSPVLAGAAWAQETGCGGGDYAVMSSRLVVK